MANLFVGDVPRERASLSNSIRVIPVGLQCIFFAVGTATPAHHLEPRGPNVASRSCRGESAFLLLPATALGCLDVDASEHDRHRRSEVG